MLFGMNATAQASVAPTTGPKLDNRRVLAAVVDLAIVVTGALVILAAGDALSSDNSDVRGALSAVILGWALYYYFALESGEGQTVGKKLMKLRVVRADGRPVGMREVAVRTVLRVVDGIGVYIVGLIAMLVSGQRRQRLGDMAAGTIVVDASAPAYAPPAPVETPSVEDAPAEDEADAEAEAEVNPVNQTPTITLPSRPAPATIDDLSAPEAPPVPEMRPFDPPAADQEPAAEVENEPVEDEPVEDEPVAAEPLAVEEPVVAAEVVVDEPLSAEPVVVDEPVVEEPVAVEPVVEEPVAVEPVVEEPVAVEPVVEEPVAAEPVVEEPFAAEPVVDEPVVEVAVVDVPAVEVAEPVEDVVEDEPVAEDPVADAPVAEEPLPELSTPSLDELVRDVEAARAEPVPVVSLDADGSDEDGSEEDEPMTVKSVETVSAIDLVMGGASEEDASSEQDQDPEGPAAS